jgi:hypothetical protein
MIGCVIMGLGLRLAGGRSDLCQRVPVPCPARHLSSHGFNGTEDEWNRVENRATSRVMPVTRSVLATASAGAKCRVSEKHLDNCSGFALPAGIAERDAPPDCWVSIESVHD